MYLLKNKAKRAIGLPSPYRSVVLEVGESEEVTDKHFEELMKATSTVNAIEQGTVEVTYLPNPVAPPPERGVKLVSKSGGWWLVYVNGHPVTDKAVRKEEAERMAAEYQ